MLYNLGCLPANEYLVVVYVCCHLHMAERNKQSMTTAPQIS